eukprot:5027112-Amphidinium_carterae.2
MACYASAFGLLSQWEASTQSLSILGGQIEGNFKAVDALMLEVIARFSSSLGGLQTHKQNIFRGIVLVLVWFSCACRAPLGPS